MDSLIAHAARALAAGDTLGALRHVALRDDPPALALRGIAMAQLGEHPRARDLLRRARRGFSTQEPLARARCAVAEAEVSLAMRELGAATRSLGAAARTLDERGDHANALQARLIDVRWHLLLGRIDQAAAMLPTLDTHGMPPALCAVAALARAEVALRCLQPDAARSALEDADDLAQQARIPALIAEVADARKALERPAARALQRGLMRPMRIGEVAGLIASRTLVVDACRHTLLAGGTHIPLARRPVLFTLARVLAQAWPGEAPRDALIAEAFRMHRPDETHRARLRVEIGRLRRLMAMVARIEATPAGFALTPRAAHDVAVLLPPVDGEAGALAALLADGAAWSTSALALATGTSQRTVQRGLTDLAASGAVRTFGQGRAQRWLAATLAGFTTSLLLPTTLPPD